jgi:hypothetical protein
MSPDCGLAALPVRSPMQRTRLRLHRKAEQPECREVAGDAGRFDDSGPFPCPGIAGYGFLHAARERRARLTN